MIKIKKHNCTICTKEHDAYGFYGSTKYLDFGFCSAECYYEYYMKNYSTMVFSHFPFAKNYNEAFNILQKSRYKIPIKTETLG